jgi:hypothetical protein
LRRFLAAETAAARRTSPEFISRMTGARNTPPPVSVDPDTKPMPALARRDRRKGGLTFFFDAIEGASSPN